MPVTPRTILYTGKGGVGKTSVAAATARRCAADGARTIVLSTDPAHSLGDALGAELGSGPTQIGDRLWAQQVEAQDEMERNWSAVQDWLGELLVERGVDRISAEELTVPPGLDELFSLLQIKRHHEAGEFDVLVVDCAPTGETLRLLSFPDVARWWLEKIFPQQGQIMAAARPFARAVLDLNLPGDAVFEDVQRLVRNLIAMNEILRDRERVSIRLVMNPDRMVIDEARRTFTYLNLYGYLTDAVVVNRVFPGRGGRLLRGVARAPAGAPARGRGRLRPRADPDARPTSRPRSSAPRCSTSSPASSSPTGDASAILHASLAHELDVSPEGATIRLDLPLSEKGDISLKKIGLELVGASQRAQAHPAPAARARRLPARGGIVRGRGARGRLPPAGRRAGEDGDRRWSSRHRETRSTRCASASAPPRRPRRDSRARRPPPPRRSASAPSARVASPPRGWQAAGDGVPGADEIAALAAIAESLRALVPRDLERGMIELLRQLLLVLQSLIEWWLHRLDRRQNREEITVEDIPIS